MTAVGFWQVAASRRDQRAIQTGDERPVSYGALLDEVNRLSRALQRLGLERGSHVVVVGAKHHDFLTVCLAGLQIGIYVIPASPRLSVDEFTYLFSDSRPAAVIGCTDAASNWTAALQRSSIGPNRSFSFNPEAAANSVQELLLMEAPDEPDRRAAGQMMLYSSGTTGKPKAVRRRLPDGTPEAAASVSIRRVLELGVTAEHGVHAITAMLYHGAPQAWSLRAAHLGHEMVLMPKWDPEDFLRVVQRERVTWSFLVPTMLYRLLMLPDDVRHTYDTSSLEAIVHAGAPCAPTVKRGVISWLGPIVHEYYASTEGGNTTLVLAKDWLKHPGTVGRPWPGVAVKIFDDAGRECAPGEIGTIYVGGPSLEGFEYHNDPEKTAAAVKDGFVTPGDLGHIDADGWVYISDRRVDLIISGGTNVYPAEVESVLVRHAAVAQAGVVGVHDDDWGQRVHAVVELVPEYEPSDELAAELIAFCRELLAPFKCPKTIRFGVLPRTDIGKLNRRSLRASEEVALASAP